MSSENCWSAGADSVGPAMQGAQSWSRQACEEVGRLAGHEWALLRVALRTGGGTGLPVEPEGGPRTLCFSALPHLWVLVFLIGLSWAQASPPAPERWETAWPLRVVITTRVTLPRLDEGCWRASLEVVQPRSCPHLGLPPSQCPEKQNGSFLSQSFLLEGQKPGEGRLTAAPRQWVPGSWVSHCREFLLMALRPPRQCGLAPSCPQASALRCGHGAGLVGRP